MGSGCGLNKIFVLLYTYFIPFGKNCEWKNTQNLTTSADPGNTVNCV